MLLLSSCSAFTLWRVEYPDALAGGVIPWERVSNGIRMSAAIRLRNVVSGAYLAVEEVSLSCASHCAC